jgi:SAM-dependent methyltransferase
VNLGPRRHEVERGRRPATCPWQFTTVVLHEPVRAHRSRCPWLDPPVDPARHCRSVPGSNRLPGFGPGTCLLATEAWFHTPRGEVVGIDISTSMLSVARARATAAACSVRFSVGDATALDEPDQSFDIARSERTLQWLSDPQAGVDELARVLRPGGRISLIDTDWSTLRLDVGDATVAERVSEAMRAETGASLERG